MPWVLVREPWALALTLTVGLRTPKVSLSTRGAQSSKILVLYSESESQRAVLAPQARKRKSFIAMVGVSDLEVRFGRTTTSELGFRWGSTEAKRCWA